MDCEAATDREELPDPSSDVLSPRELDVVKLICKSQGATAIAQRLHIGTGTVDTHRASAYKKLGIHDAVTLVCWAIRTGVHEV